MICFARRALALLSLSVLAGCQPGAASRTGEAGSSASDGDEARHAAATATAARDFVSTLSDSTRRVALRGFSDPDRTRWFFIPIEIIPNGRAGLPLGRMTPTQRDAAFGLLGTALSASGDRTARAIIANETDLGALENAAGTRRFDRNPDLYYVTVFDTATGAEPWGWRFEGHHLSVNVTGAGMRGPAVTAPLFMGANPHRVPSGPRAGSRLLAAEEDAARALLAALTPAQRAEAIVSDTTYGDIRTRNDPKASALPDQGIAASALTLTQQLLLRRLLEVYAGRLEASNARAQWSRIDSSGFGRLRFVWAGSTDVGKAHYYRVQGPTVIVEYDNTQNGANHSHTVWRDLRNDFGEDVLREHYRKHAH